MAIFRAPDGLQYLMSDELAASFAQGSKAFEGELVEWAAQFLHPGTIFVDVGAHVGTWAFPFARRARRVVAIEALRKNFDFLTAGARLNNLSNIDCHHAAATYSFAPTVTLNVGVRDWSGFGGSLADFPINGETVPEVVPALRIDSLALADVGLVKIDVEGHEREVVAGMVETLRHSGWPPLLVEVWSDKVFPWYRDKRTETLAYFGALDYRCIPVAGWPHMQLLAHS
jgi:FkbM family methyltransferase